MEPQPRVNVSRIDICRLCGQERPVGDLTMAADAQDQPVGPVCRADAPGPLACLAVRDLRDRWATALRLGTKLYLEREDVEAMRAIIVKEGWVAA